MAMKWTSRGKKNVPYVWTANDHGLEHGSKPDGVEDPRVTTYRIVPKKLPGAAGYDPGQAVTIDLDMIPQLGESSTINRFYPADEFDWEKLEGDEAEQTKDCKTIGELCQKLYSLNPRKYVENYYNFEKLSKDQRHAMAAMLFEYWDNTQFRYEVTKSGFDWRVMNPKGQGAPSLPAAKGSARLLYVMVRKPPPIKRDVAPGAQTLFASPDIFKLLDLHVGEINEKVARAQALLDQSEQYMKDRARLAQQVTALRVLLQASASAKTEQPAKATALVDKARSVEQKIDKPSREAKLSELFAMDKGAHSPSLVKVIRKELGLVDDIAAALSTVRDQIAGTLFDDDTLFAKHVDAFATWARDRKQEQSQPVQQMYSKLAFAMAAALDILNETGLPESHFEKLKGLTDNFPKKAFTAVDKARRSLAEKISAFLGMEPVVTVWPWLKAVSSTVPSLVGNLAGPPSVYIAVIQARAWRELNKVMADLGPGSDEALVGFIDSTIKRLELGEATSPEFKAKFSKALRYRNVRAIGAMKREILDEFSGTYQSTKGWKVGGLLLQTIATAIAMLDFFSKKDPELIDMINAGTAAAGWFVGFVDVLSTLAKNSFRVLQPLGMAVGLVTSFAGVIASTLALKDAVAQGDKLGVVASGVGVLGNMLFYVACVAWFVGAPVPGLNIAATFLLAGSSFLMAVHDEGEKQKTMASKVARSIVNEIRLNPFYSLFEKAESGEAEQMSKVSVDSLLTTIEEACREGWLRAPPNNNFVLDALSKAGFDRETIMAVVEASGSPISPELQLKPT